MKKSTLLPLALLSLSSFFAIADEQNETHRVGAQLSVGSASYNGSSKNGNDVGQFYLYYDYQFDNTWALELGFNGASTGDESCANIDKNYSCQSNDTLFNTGIDKAEYSNFVVAAKGQVNITENNSLYGKVGGQAYNYSMYKKSQKIADADGFGLFLETGWQYDWDNGFAMNVAWQYIEMSELDVNTLGVGISYRF